MERQSRVHLDHPAIRGRIRNPQVRHARTNQIDADIRPMRSTTSQSVPALSKPAPAPMQSQKTQKTTANKTPAVTPQHPTSLLKQPPVLKIRTTPLPHTSAESNKHLPRQTRSGVLRRQMVKASAKKYRPKKHYSYKPYLFAGLAVLAILLTSAVGLVGYTKLHSTPTQTGVLAKQTSRPLHSATDGTSGSDLPSENNPPIDIKGYTVAPNMPRFLKIDKIGVNARVRRVGPNENGGVKGPSNIYDVGWYENSSLPGDNGTVLIDGHVAGQSNRGVFYSLSTLKKGDKIEFV